MIGNKDVVLWDWNGTLLNDIDVCLEAMNILLKRRNLELLDIERYRDVFDFPVKKYYSRLGFDFEKEAFEIPAIEFIVEYKKLLHKSSVFEDVVDTLMKIKETGAKQYIVSAMESKALKKSVAERDIEPYFNDIYGIEDDYAHGKSHLLKKLLSRIETNPQKVVMIGDTIHDYEIAKEAGIDILLVARGHQSVARLKNTGAIVLNDFTNLFNGAF